MEDKKEKKKPYYVIETALYVESLESRVQEMVDDGYVPFGTLIIMPSKGSTQFEYFQPMILKEKNEKTKRIL